MTQVKSSGITKKDFSIFSHRGFGEKTYARYVDTKRLRYVHNQLSGLELGIEKGADTLEIDLCKTSDGKIVTAHGIPLQKYLPDTEQEYLEKYPEALTFQELLDWISNQHLNISLYLELKSPLMIKEFLKEFEQYAGGNHEILNRLYQQLMIYTHDIQIIKSLVTEKQQFGLSTQQLRISWVSLGFITTNDIDKISQIGKNDCKLYSIELGTIPWGFKPFVYLLNLPIPPFIQINKHLKRLNELVIYAHEKHLKFIVGTVDDTKLIRMLIGQGVNGIVPNNPLSISKAGIKRKESNTLVKYIPESMKLRLGIS